MRLRRWPRVRLDEFSFSSLPRPHRRPPGQRQPLPTSLDACISRHPTPVDVLSTRACVAVALCRRNARGGGATRSVRAARTARWPRSPSARGAADRGPPPPRGSGRRKAGLWLPCAPPPPAGREDPGPSTNARWQRPASPGSRLGTVAGNHRETLGWGERIAHPLSGGSAMSATSENPCSPWGDGEHGTHNRVELHR